MSHHQSQQSHMSLNFDVAGCPEAYYQCLDVDEQRVGVDLDLQLEQQHPHVDVDSTMKEFNDVPPSSMLGNHSGFYGDELGREGNDLDLDFQDVPASDAPSLPWDMNLNGNLDAEKASTWTDALKVPAPFTTNMLLDSSPIGAFSHSYTTSLSNPHVARVKASRDDEEYSFQVDDTNPFRPPHLAHSDTTSFWNSPGLYAADHRRPLDPLLDLDAEAGIPLDGLEDPIDSQNVMDPAMSVGEGKINGQTPLMGMGEMFPDPSHSMASFSEQPILGTTNLAIPSINNRRDVLRNPNAMTSNRHQEGVAGSFPTTAHHFPNSIFDHMTMFNASNKKVAVYDENPEHKKQKTSSQPQQSLPIQSGPKRRPRASSGAKIDKKLMAISEGTERDLWLQTRVEPFNGKDNGFCYSHSPTSDNKPRRKGELEDHKKMKAALMRKTDSVCLSCKQRRVDCDFDPESGLPCTACRRGKGARARLCVEGKWIPQVKQAPCRSPFYTLVQVPSSNRLVWRTTPKDFDITSLRAVLYALRGTHNVRAETATGYSYTIDIAACYNLLATIPRSFTLQDLFLPEGVGTDPSDWLNVVRDHNLDLRSSQRLLKWAALPFLTRFVPVTAGDSSSFPFGDLDDFYPLVEAMVAVNRIICRAVTLLAHDDLEKRCKSIMQSKTWLTPDQIQDLYQDIGQTACALRLRLAWMDATKRRPSFTQDRTVMTDIIQLQKVARILYFFTLKVNERKRKAGMPDTNYTNYLEFSGRKIRDPFPTEDTEPGFSSWLAEGDEVLKRAGLEPDAIIDELSAKAPMPPPFHTRENRGNTL